jgi:hypothetical protein
MGTRDLLPEKGVGNFFRGGRRNKKKFPNGRDIPQNPSMRRILTRLIAVLFLTAAAYVFWPREASLDHFRPVQLEALRIEALREAREEKTVAMLVPLYRIFQEEFHFRPLAAAEAAWQTSRALRLFLDSADNADRERALEPLEKMFAIVRSETGSEFDPPVVARLQLFCWMLAGDTRKQSQLRSAIAEKLALLHGGSAAEFTGVAEGFARADRLLASKNEDEARRAGVSAWRRLSEQLKARLPAN